MPEGLTPDQSEQAAKLAGDRAKWGKVVAELQQRESAATQEAQSHKGLAKLLHRKEIAMAKSRAEEARSLIAGATAGNTVAEANAASHFNEHKDAYMEQAQIDAQAAGIQIDSTRQLAGHEPTAAETREASEAEPTPPV